MLTDLQCRKAAAQSKPFKLADERGLFLYVTPTGFKGWRLKYRFAGTEKTFIIGPYPEVSLGEAREARDAARRLLRSHQDPNVVREQERAAAKVQALNTFEAVARDWHARQKPLWSRKHADQVIASLELHAFRKLGKLPLGAITPPMLLAVIREVEKGSIDIAKRVQRRMDAIFAFAIAIGIGRDNPAAAIRRALSPMMRGRFPAITELERLRAFLLAAEKRDALPQTRLANRFLALTAVRPSMVRLMPPGEIFDLEGEQPEWRIPAERMKLLKDRKFRSEFDFIVPLSRQAVDVLKEARRRFGNALYVFPSAANPRRALSDGTIGKYLRVDGYAGEHVPHGWRSSFSTIMNKRAAQMKRTGDRALIDLMLAHLPGDVESDYNRYAYLDERRELAQAWADMLLEGFAPAASLMSDPLPRGIVRSQEPRRERRGLSSVRAKRGRPVRRPKVRPAHGEVGE